MGILKICELRYTKKSVFTQKRKMFWRTCKVRCYALVDNRLMGGRTVEYMMNYCCVAQHCMMPLMAELPIMCCQSWVGAGNNFKWLNLDSRVYVNCFEKFVLDCY